MNKTKANDHVPYTFNVSKKILVQLKKIAIDKDAYLNALITDALINYFHLDVDDDNADEIKKDDNNQ